MGWLQIAAFWRAVNKRKRHDDARCGVIMARYSSLVA